MLRKEEWGGGGWVGRVCCGPDAFRMGAGGFGRGGLCGGEGGGLGSAGGCWCYRGEEAALILGSNVGGEPCLRTPARGVCLCKWGGMGTYHGQELSHSP